MSRGRLCLCMYCIYMPVPSARSDVFVSWCLPGESWRGCWVGYPFHVKFDRKPSRCQLVIVAIVILYLVLKRLIPRSCPSPAPVSGQKSAGPRSRLNDPPPESAWGTLAAGASILHVPSPTHRTYLDRVTIGCVPLVRLSLLSITPSPVGCAR